MFSTHLKHNLQNPGDILAECVKKILETAIFVAVFSFVMQQHDFRLTTLYKYPEEKLRQSFSLLLCFETKILNISLVRQLKRNIPSVLRQKLSR